MIQINNRHIGPGQPCYIIAELSANHCQDKNIALASVEAAKEAGANAIKLQTFKPGSITLDIDRDEFLANPQSPWKGRKLYDLYNETMLPWEWHEEIFDKAREVGIDCFSSPFDMEAVQFLESLKTPAYKIASFEITDIPLISKCAKTGKTMIISTGIATKDDIELALKTCHEAENENIILLKCTSAYPTPPNEADLIMIREMSERFGVATGLSDHTEGIHAASIAVTLGACVIEKHFKINDNIKSADAGFSLNKNQFKEMVKLIRSTEEMLGKVNYEIDQKKALRRVRRRALYIVKDVKKGELVSNENVRSIRPGNGLHPRFLEDVMGKRFNKDILSGTPLNRDLLL